MVYFQSWISRSCADLTWINKTATKLFGFRVNVGLHRRFELNELKIVDELVHELFYEI